MTRLFVDANVPLHATGGDHPLRAPCRQALRAIAARDLPAATSALVLQEVLHHCVRGRASPEVFDRFYDLLTPEILSVEPADVVRARRLAEQHPGIPAGDLVHVATMRRHGLDSIVTTDRHFDALPGITRVDPRDLTG